MWTGPQDIPAWLVILGCGVATQVIKLVGYSLTQRRLALPVLVQNHGFPSLTSAVLTCLLVVVVIRQGWESSQAGFALVFAIIVIHDTIKLRVAASQQREVVFLLVETMPEAGPFHKQVADYLDPRTHHPAHVTMGVLLGGLFALAFGLTSG